MTEDTFDKILHLVAESPYHKHWTVEDVANLIEKPIDLYQYIIGVNDDETVFFFATFATPEEHHIREYFANNRFPVEGFEGKGDDVWVIDFICMGGRSDVAISFRCIKNLLLSMGYDKCFWLRTETKRLGFHIVKE